MPGGGTPVSARHEVMKGGKKQYREGNAPGRLGRDSVLRMKTPPEAFAAGGQCYFACVKPAA
jgi:hypothetical protein